MDASNNETGLTWYKRKLLGCSTVFMFFLLLFFIINNIPYLIQWYDVYKILNKSRTEENIIREIGFPFTVTRKGEKVYCKDGYYCPNKEARGKVFVYWPGNVKESLRDVIFDNFVEILYVYFDENGIIEDFVLAGS